MKINRATLCKLLRKTPSEIDSIDYRDVEELILIFDELGEKNPLMML